MGIILMLAKRIAFAGLPPLLIETIEIMVPTMEKPNRHTMMNIRLISLILLCKRPKNNGHNTVTNIKNEVVSANLRGNTVNDGLFSKTKKITNRKNVKIAEI